MKSYREVVARLDLPAVCLGDCGLSDHRHRGSLFLGVVHFGERRISKRGLRRFLRLCAKRDRLDDPGFLNSPELSFAHGYFDEAKAVAWAARLGYRFPVGFSRAERLRVLAKAPKGFARTHAAIWAWARRGLD